MGILIQDQKPRTPSSYKPQMYFTDPPLFFVAQ